MTKNKIEQKACQIVVRLQFFKNKTSIYTMIVSTSLKTQKKLFKFNLPWVLWY